MSSYPDLDARVPGAQGTQGSYGPQGAQGAPGVGIQGPQGGSGPQGTQGLGGVGGSGPQGAPGAQGPQGFQNAPGAQGAQGANGAQGAQGASGPVGAAGTYSTTYAGNVASLNTSGYMGAYYPEPLPVSTLERAQRFIVPAVGFLKKMLIAIPFPASGARVNTFYATINGSDDATFTKAMNAAAGTLGTVTGSVAVSAGDEIAIHEVASGASGTFPGGPIYVTLSFEAT